MKRIYFVLFGIALMMSSCVTTYDSAHLKSVYQSQMYGSKKGKTLMEKIPIYFNESEVPFEFTVTSYCSYRPFTVPIFRPEKKVITKKFYKIAVKTAENEKGDAVIIDSTYEFRVIKAKK